MYPLLRIVILAPFRQPIRIEANWLERLLYDQRRNARKRPTIIRIPRRITGRSVKSLRLDVGKVSCVHTALVMLSSVNYPVYMTR